MEVSAEEMVKMFDLHKDRAWSFHLEPMGERRYPRTVEITMEGYRLDQAMLRLRYTVGPDTLRDVRYPLGWLLGDVIQSLRLSLEAQADAVRQSVPCESTERCGSRAGHTCSVHQALASWLKRVTVTESL